MIHTLLPSKLITEKASDPLVSFLSPVIKNILMGMVSAFLCMLAWTYNIMAFFCLT